jgi:hypothetical protein
MHIIFFITKSYVPNFLLTTSYVHNFSLAHIFFSNNNYVYNFFCNKIMCMHYTYNIYLVWKIKKRKEKIRTPVNRRQRVRTRLLLHRGKRENGNRTTHVNEES